MFELCSSHKFENGRNEIKKQIEKVSYNEINHRIKIYCSIFVLNDANLSAVVSMMVKFCCDPFK